MAGAFDPTRAPILEDTSSWAGSSASKDKRNWFSAGLSSGTDNLQGLLGSAVELGGRLTGLKGVEDYGAGVASRNIAEAQANGRDDLEIAPWKEGGASVLPWLAYQTTKQIPQLAGFVAAGAATGGLGLAPTALARAGMAAPAILGGGRGLAGAAAEVAGQQFANRAIGALAVGTPMGQGALYQAAKENAVAEGREVSTGEALTAAIGGVPYAALDMADIGILKGLGGQVGKGLAKRIMTGAAVGAASELPQEGVQTAMEQSFRQDLSVKERFANIVDGALTGAAVGGTLGGIASVRRAKTMDPADVDIDGITREVLGLPAPSVSVDSAGRAAMGSNGLDTLLETPADSGRSASDRVVSSYNPDMQPQIESQTIIQPKQGSLRWSKPYEQGSSGPFGSTTQTELETITDAMANHIMSAETPNPKILVRYDQAVDELNFRNENSNASVSNDPLDTTVAGAVEQDANVSGGVVLPTAPAPAPITFDPVATLAGISTRKAYADVTSEDELRARLAERLGSRTPGKGDFVLAERLGIDINEAGAPVASASSAKPAAAVEEAAPAVATTGISEAAIDKLRAAAGLNLGGIPTDTTTEPAAPANQEGGDATVDAEFQQEFRTKLDGDAATGVKAKRGVSINAMRENMPVNREEAMGQVYDALGASQPDAVGETQETPFTGKTRPDGFNGVYELAQEMGVLDTDGQLTEEGFKVARSRLPLELTTTAAQTLGHTGTEAAIFDSGARGDTNVKLASVTQLKAFNDGRDWAIDRTSKGAPIPQTLGNAATENTMREATSSENGDAINRKAVTSTGLSPEVEERMWLNRAIDEIYGPRMDPAAATQLKILAKTGATTQEIDAAAAKFEAGETVLANPPAERKPFAGETSINTRFGDTVVIERGALTRSREKARILNENLLLRREAEAKAGSKRTRGDRANTVAAAELASSKAEFDRAKDSLRSAIQDAYEAGEINAIERIALVGKLVRNDFAGIEEGLHGGVLSQRQAAVSRRDFLNGVAAIAVAGGLPGRSRAAVPGVAAKAGPMLALQMRAGNITGSLELIKSGSSNPIYRVIAAKLLRANWSNVRLSVMGSNSSMLGEATLQDDGSTDVAIYGAEAVNEETFLHEMIHAFVQQRWASTSSYLPSNREKLKDTTDRADQQIYDFQKMWNTFATAFKDQNPSVVDERVWAQQIWADPDEMLSWVMTNRDAQTFLKSIDINGEKMADSSNPSLWSKFVNFFRDMLGMPPSAKALSALDHILSAGMGILDAGAKIQSNDWSVKLAQGMADRRNAPMSEKMINIRQSVPQTADISNAQVKDAIAVGTKIATALDPMSLKGKMREIALGWMSQHGITEQWDKLFEPKADSTFKANGLRAHEAALNEKNAIVSKMAQMVTNVRDRYEQLLSNKNTAGSAKTIVQIMQASEMGIDPTKPWREQSKRVQDSKNKANLQRLHKEFHDKYRALQASGHSDVYQSLREVNDVVMLASLSGSLHEHVANDAYARNMLPEFAENPMTTYMAAQTKRDFTPADARKWWDEKLETQIAASFKFTQGQRAANVPNAQDSLTDARNKETVTGQANTLGAQIFDAQQARDSLGEAPYFHLGRYGDFFISWKVADDVALAKVAEALAAKGFEGIITNGTEKTSVFMRVETRAQWKQLNILVQALAKQQVVTEGSVVSGQRTKDAPPDGIKIKGLQTLIDNIKASDLPDDMKDAEIAGLQARALDALPEHSLARIMTQRKEIPGYSPDMMRSFDWRNLVGIQALAGQATAPKITQALVDQRAALKVAERGGGTLDERVAMRNIVDEVSRRERERPLWPHTRALDQIRAVSTAWFLGFSLSYGAVNLTQLGATLWPELGSRHGFVASANAIWAAVAPAIKIMRAVAAHGYSVSLDRSMDAVITQDVLVKAVGADMAEYLMHVVNTGNLDIGGASREMARSAEGRGDGGVDRVLRYASAIGYYTETASRLIAAIATKRLNPNLDTKDAAERAAHVLNETMWNYARTNQGRQFGKMGVLGAATPLATQFLQFQAQLTEKLFREIHTAIKGDTDESKAQARKYLKGHLSAMTVLAGSLGLPMVTVFATAIDRLKDLLDDDEEPTNVRAAYRNWLSSTLGNKDFEEMISHGIFRGAGIDIAGRIGEQDIIPLSKFLADRREFKERVTELAFRTWGAPTSLASNIFQGAGDIMDGDIMSGMTKMLPNGLAGPAKSFKLMNDGFVDAQGRKLPTSREPGVNDIIAQLMGFNPAIKAESSEATQMQAIRAGILTERAKTLSTQLAKALESGDRDEAKKIIEQAMVFDTANPTFGILDSIGDKIRTRGKATPTARAIGAPIGVNVRDLDGQALTKYANY